MRKLINVKKQGHDFELYIGGTLVGGLMFGQGFVYWTGYPIKHCDIVWHYERLPDNFKPPRRPVQVEGKVFKPSELYGIVKEFRAYDMGKYQQINYSHICDHPGCTLHATEYQYPVADARDKRNGKTWLCDDHAAESGFCISCGWFMLGSGDESSTSGWCTECLEETLLETGDYDSDDPYDNEDYLSNPYEDEWHDKDSGLSELEQDLGNDSNGRYIGEGSEYPPGVDDD